MNMRRSTRLTGAAVSLSGAALLVGGALAQPAAAVDIPWGQANFYTGTNLTGTVYPIPVTDTACANLPEPMLSVANFKYANVEIFKGKDCTYGLGNVTGLHWWNPPAPIYSYRVLPAWPPAQ
ncbi:MULTISPECIES: hypothetical protein [Streptomyces]|uniref:Secreted protein n=1 Tax=Streptomyces flaveolus TaxID=67297 RepID=A0ABV3ALW9_9ACTN|nr:MULTISPECIES: hypothetical protein [Streptomyces]KOG61393.1 hypothetical protein ADK77_32440 [Streptomyces antibioticus]